jgi:hypothetical protein
MGSEGRVGRNMFGRIMRMRGVIRDGKRCTTRYGDECDSFYGMDFERRKARLPKSRSFFMNVLYFESISMPRSANARLQNVKLQGDAVEKGAPGVKGKKRIGTVRCEVGGVGEESSGIGRIVTFIGLRFYMVCLAYTSSYIKRCSCAYKFCVVLVAYSSAAVYVRTPSSAALYGKRSE